MFGTFILIVGLITQVVEALSGVDSKSVRFRSGMKKDELKIRMTLLTNFMNPLVIDSKRFIVAVNPSNDDDLYGWAQLRPLGFNILDSTNFDSKPGSGSIEQDIEEIIWDEFDREEIVFPTGLASLPWSKEYNRFANQSSKRRERADYLMKRSKLELKNDRNQLWELASVYVLPKWRQNGIGSELIRRIILRHVSFERSLMDVYLMTVESRRAFYENLGFSLANDIPAAMEQEMSIGRIVSKIILGSNLIAMRGTYE